MNEQERAVFADLNFHVSAHAGKVLLMVADLEEADPAHPGCSAISLNALHAAELGRALIAAAREAST